ncbi:unnamed protein product, partial [Rotaria sp. Silwood1]
KESIKRKRNETSSKQSSNTIDKSLNKKRSKSKKEINYNNDYSYISDYLQVTNRIFKQMLISSLEGVDKIVKRLNTSEKINYIRQYAYLIHRLFYVQLQESQWKYYYDIGMQENIWFGLVSKKWAAMNSMHHTYGRSKTLIVQRLLMN